MNDGKTRVMCAFCGREHRLTPSAMGVVIDAFQAGTLTTIGTENGLTLMRTLCILTALATVDARTATRKYRGVIAWQTE